MNAADSKYLNWFLRKLVRLKQSENGFMIGMGVLIGILGGYGAIFFRYVIKFFQYLFFQTSDVNLAYLQDYPWYLKVIIPGFGGLVVGLIVHYIAREAKGPGVPEVMESIIQHDGVIRARVILAKIFASSISIASGGSVGREGPIVQIGSAAGSLLGQFTHVRGSQLKTFVACGAAAGVAGTFNAPIAGSIFALEILLGDFAIAQFSPIVIASVTSTVISRHYLGNTPAFVIPKYELVSVYEFIPYSILGVLSAFLAIAFVTLVNRSEDFFEGLSLPEWLKPALGGVLVGTIGIFFPQVFGVGYETMDLTLSGQLSWAFLVMLIALKLIATAITVGSGGSGGIFAPALFIGGSLGGAIGTFSHSYFPGISAHPGSYALVGMGALTAALMHAPISSILILFELTNDYRIILPLMTSIIISVVLKMHVNKNSIYALKLLRKGIDPNEKKETNILKNIQIKSFYKKECVKVKADTPFKHLAKLVKKNIHLNYFVVDNDERYLGLLSPFEIRILKRSKKKSFLEDLTAQDLILENKSFFTPEDSLDVVGIALQHHVLDEIPVVNNAQERKILGYISKTEIIHAYNQSVMKTDMLTSVSSYLNSAPKFRKQKLIQNEMLCELEIPGSFVDHPLKELNLRAKFGIEVILIKQNYDISTNECDCIFTPTPDYIFKYGDRILIIAKDKNISRIEALV